MKRLLALSLVLAVLLSSVAFGAVQDFGKFTLNIPEGWTAKIAEGNDPEYCTVDITGNDSSISFTYAPTNGYSLEDLLEDWTNMEPTSSKPERTTDGYYMYTYKNEEGKKVVCYVRAESDGKMYTSSEMTGNDTQTMTAIRDSFTLKK